MIWAWAKCMPWPLWLVYLPQHVYANVSMTLSYALRGRGRIIAKAKFDALRGLPGQLRKRRRVQADMRAQPSDIRAALDRGIGIFVPKGLRP